jgi:hypothetical protein
MATLATVLAFSRAQAQTDSNGLTDANGIIFANSRLVDFHRQLVNHGVDASQLQEAYTSGTASVGTYAYPTDMLALKTIELNYTSTNTNDYVTASQVDVANLAGNESFSSLRLNAPTQSPSFDDRGDWYEIFPTPISGNNLTNMIRIFYYLKPTEYAATSDTVAYPESLDYRILGWGVAADYKYSLGDMISGVAFEQKYQERVTQYISTLAKGSQQPIQATVLNVGDNGWSF